MKKYTVEFREQLLEKLVDTAGGKVGEEYKSLKMGVLQLVDDTMKGDSELVNAENLMGDYVKGDSGKNLVGMVDNIDIYNFYLKYQSNIDEVCNDLKYFEKAPVSNNVFSLYDVVIDGTKFAVKEIVKILLKEIFK